MISEREKKAHFRMEMGRAAMLTREGLRITKMGRQTMETSGAVPGGILAIMAAPAATIAGQHRIEARRIAREAGWLSWAYAPEVRRRGCSNCRFQIQQIDCTSAARSGCAHAVGSTPGWEPKR